MNAMVIYDSAFGNTAKLADAMAEAIDTKRVKLVEADEVEIDDLENTDLLIVGSPTQGGRPTVPIKEFIDKIPKAGLENKKIAVFDTRFSSRDHNPALRLLMKIIGFAARPMAESLQAKGGKLVAEPEGFIVEDKTGPLKEGELERAAAWAKNIANLI